jgi:putative hydrolase of HD superfamily
MLATLLEVQRLKHLDRTGWTLRGLAPGAESVGAHTYGVAVVAMLLADAVRARGVAVDVGRVMRMALVHDWAETRLGDLPRTAAHYFGGEARHAAEEKAFADIVHPLGDAAAELRAAHEEYERRVTVEARLVKASDVIDLLAQALLFEQSGVRGLDEFWSAAREYDFGLDGAAGDVVAELFADLVRQREMIGTTVSDG